MEFRILGPLEVHDGRELVAVSGAKPRAVLALLLLNANVPMSAERLAIELWGEDVPQQAVKTVQVHVSRLRKALGHADAIKTSSAGYCLQVRPGELDADRFAELLEDGRRALEAGDTERAAATLRSALALWRGAPLADLASESFAQREVARLEEQRLTAMEARFEADLALGHEDEVIGELQRLVEANPTRERLAELLMLALYRSGRQAEALETYRRCRTGLIEEIGVEPGPDLRHLHAAILRQDRSLLGERAVELPRELERALAEPLEGRDVELMWLRNCWERAMAGAGATVTVGGEHGIGKSRLAAEFAAEAHARGATVLFVDGEASSAAALGVLARAEQLSGPTLLVVDHADLASAAVRERLAAFPDAVADAPILTLVLDAASDADPDGGALVLAPLDVGAVHAIVSRYVPEHAEDDPPAEWLLGASRGVPQLVHELAGQWARREAGRRVEVSAERTAAQRADLQALERQLAADVVVLETARADVAGERPADALVCPFKGLAPFQVADAPYFFGRERLVAELVARLVGASLLGLVGPSGSGKSSALRAGLMPALAAGVLPGSERWHQVVIRPGAHPVAELRSAVARHPDGPLMLAVDQFEEIFTTCDDARERAAFVAELTRLAVSSDGGGAVALAIRADFYGRCAEYPELAHMLASGHVLVGGMRADDLRRAIEGPAEHAGLIVDEDLVDALVADVDGEPGALPLLSTALLELWQQRDGRRLRHGAYERAGGVRGAVARLGENAFASLDESQQQMARRVMLRLATVDSEGGVERRRVARAEIGGEEAAEVVGLLADRRLLTIHAGTVEIAHEALLREWPRLRGWIDEDRDALRVHERLRSDTREWVRLDRDDGALLRGARLAETRRWIEPDAVDLGETEREFLAASVESDRVARAARRRRLQLAFGALAAALLVIGAVALIAIQQRRDAEHERNVALSRQLSSQSAQALDTDPELALRLAMWADEIAPARESAAALRQATLGFRQIAVLPADHLTADTAAYSPDGGRIVTGGDTGIARLWDPGTRKEIARLAPDRGKLLAARYSPDGSRIALAFEQGVLVTDGALRGQREVLANGAGAITDVAFDSRGARLAVALGTGKVRLVGVDGGQPGVTLDVATDVAVRGVDMDGQGRVVTADDDGAVKLWDPQDAASSRTLRAGGKPERDVRFSPDGRLVLAVGEDGRARLWNAGTGTAKADVSAGPRKLTAAAFSPDGRRFATAGYDGAVQVWTTEGASRLLVLRGQLSRVLDVGFGASSDRVVSAGDDGTAKIWNAAGIRAFKGPADLTNADYSPSGRWIATGGWDGKVRVWDAARGTLARTLPGPDGYASARFSPTADELVVGRDPTSTVLLWPLSADRPSVAAQLPQGRGINAARFDPTGKRIVYADVEGAIVVRDLGSGREWRLRGGPSDVWDVRVSRDGRHAAAATEDGVLYVWDLNRPGAPEHRLRGHRGHVNAVDYSADGRIVTAGADRTARVWDPSSGRQLVLRGHSDEVTAAVFTHGGDRVLTASADGTVRLWDARDGEPLVTLESSPDVPVYDVSEGPDGMIATLDDNQVVRVFRCTVCGSIGQVRAAARALRPRELTAEEKRRFLARDG